MRCSRSQCLLGPRAGTPPLNPPPPPPSVPSPQHRTNDASNTPDMPFDFTLENYKIVNTILAKYPKT